MDRPIMTTSRDDGGTPPQPEAQPAATSRKFYVRPHLVCILPLEASAGSPLWDDLDPETRRPYVIGQRRWQES